MPYLSLASPLRQKMGMQGTKQEMRQHRKPLWPRSLALWYCWHGRQKVPQQPGYGEEMSVLGLIEYACC